MHTLLSEQWHAVRFLRPRLRVGVQALHRRLRGKPCVLLYDPLTQRFHRLTPEVHAVLRLLDGRRTLEAAWDAACASAADDERRVAISQHELVQLVASLYANELLQTQVAPDADEAFERYQRRERGRLKQTWLNLMSLRLPLFYPDAWFERQAGLARKIFSWPVLVLWLALVLPALALGWQHWRALSENLADRVLAANNVVLLWFTYPLVKAVHEWAHGIAVKAFGGNVREIGLMFIVFTPVPYVDATSSYRFPSKWARAAVAAAGIMAELALGALALYLWLTAESGLVRAIAFNVVLIAGVSSVAVNGNPLMRYDGYFIFCDLIELPNLAQRAQQYWTYLIDRYAFAARDAQPPNESAGERGILFFYGALAPVYRLTITFGIIWFVASEYLFVGVVMALAFASTALVVPLWRGFKHLVDSPALARRRDSALRRTALAVALLVAFLAFVPLPFHSLHQAVVWLPEEAIVRAEVAGQVTAAFVRPGELITSGARVLVLDSAQLSADGQLAQSAVERARVQLRKAETEDLVAAQSLRDEIRALAAREAEAQRRLQSLTLTATTAGRWTPVAATELAGRYVKRGEVLGYIVGDSSRLLRAAVTQEDMELVASRLQGVEVRLANDLRHTVAAHIRRRVPGGEFDLVSPALGSSGGGEIAVDPAQSGGKRALQRIFDVEIEMRQPSSTPVFGDRAFVRFDLKAAPLGWQAFLRLRQLFLARLNV